MCLIVFGWQAHAEFPLIVAGNRDEYHERPTSPLAWWADQRRVLAGRDLRAGGTWLGAGRAGRFATVTNFRETKKARATLRSRGELVSKFVSGNDTPEAFAHSIDSASYAGFSLLLADAHTLCYTSNLDAGRRLLPPGIYALGNAALDEPSHRLSRSKAAFRAVLDADELNETNLFRLLADQTPAPVADVDAAGVSFEIARALTAPFIVTPEYGTRCTSVLLWSAENRITLAERRFDNSGAKTGESKMVFTPDDQSA